MELGSLAPAATKGKIPMTTFNTLVNTVKAMVSPAAKAPAKSNSGASVPQVKMAADSVQLSKRSADDYRNDGFVQLQRAQIRMADLVGDTARAITASKAQEAQADDFMAQIAIRNERGGLVRQGEKVNALARLTGRLAANSGASNEDRLALASLVNDAQGARTAEELGRLLLKAEDVVRNAGRTPRSDLGLHNATIGVVQQLGQLEDSLTQLEQDSRNAYSAEELQKIQLKLADLQQDRATLQGFKAQADRLANKRGATGEDLDAMKRLMAQAIAAPNPEERRNLLVEAEFIARNAGGPQGDLGLHNATKGLVAKLGDVEAAMGALVDDAQNIRSSEELQKIQIKVADLARDRDTLLALKAEADRVANSRDALDPGDREALLHGLTGATRTDRPSALLAILAEARTIGR